MNGIMIGKTNTWPRCLVRLARLAALAAVAGLLAGCQANRPMPGDRTLRTEACRYLVRAVRSESVEVRVNAIEAMVHVAPHQVLPYVREYILDESAVVRSAACIAAGELRDLRSAARLLRALEDEDHRVRMSAAFGLYCLSAGEEARLNYARLLADGLREGNPLVRRHAAMLIGMTGDTGAAALLRHFFRDDDEWVEYQVAEAMALLGDDKAVEQLVSYTFRGNPLRQALALLALSRCGGPRAEKVLRYRLANADYVEVQLAAAEGLGRMGFDDGLAAALNTLEHGRPDPDAPPQDTPANQLTRLELMASSALAQVGRREALPTLWRLLEYASRYPPDPAGVSTATAVLSILQTDASQTWSLARSRGPGQSAGTGP